MTRECELGRVSDPGLGSADVSAETSVVPEQREPSRRRLMVEEYRPEYRAAATERAIPTGRLSSAFQLTVSRFTVADTSRPVTALVVSSLHIVLGLWLWSLPGVLRPISANPTQLVLLDPIPAQRSAAHPTAPLDIPAPTLPPLAMPSIRPPRYIDVPQQPVEVALTVSGPTDVMISDASAADVRRVLTLLVRVEKDGRISDSKIEVSSGTPRVDQAAQRCLVAHGVLEPHRVNGEPIPSWQRVHGPLEAHGKSARVT
jgi:hypothetical protein